MRRGWFRIWEIGGWLFVWEYFRNLGLGRYLDIDLNDEDNGIRKVRKILFSINL